MHALEHHSLAPPWYQTVRHKRSHACLQDKPSTVYFGACMGIGQLQTVSCTVQEVAAWLNASCGGAGPFLLTTALLMADLARGGNGDLWPWLSLLPPGHNCLLAWTPQEQAALAGCHPLPLPSLNTLHHVRATRHVCARLKTLTLRRPMFLTAHMHHAGRFCKPVPSAPSPRQPDQSLLDAGSASRSLPAPNSKKWLLARLCRGCAGCSGAPQCFRYQQCCCIASLHEAACRSSCLAPGAKRAMTGCGVQRFGSQPAAPGGGRRHRRGGRGLRVPGGVPGQRAAPPGAAPLLVAAGSQACPVLHSAPLPPLRIHLTSQLVSMSISCLGRSPFIT